MSGEFIYRGTRQGYERFIRWLASTGDCAGCPSNGAECRALGEERTCGDVLRKHIIFEEVRWRAERGGDYFLIAETGIVTTNRDHRTAPADLRYRVGNYYQTQEEAEAAAERIRRAYLGEG